MFARVRKKYVNEIVTSEYTGGVCRPNRVNYGARTPPQQDKSSATVLLGQLLSLLWSAFPSLGRSRNRSRHCSAS